MIRTAMLFLVVAFLFFGNIAAQTPAIEITISDTYAYPGQVITIDFHLSNFYDTMAGFNTWFQLDRPDVMFFHNQIDTVVDTTYWECLEWSGPDCVDSQMVFEYQDWDFYYVDTVEILTTMLDTNGALISDWEWVDARSLNGYATDISVAGIANLPPPPNTPGIAPQEGGLFFRTMAVIVGNPGDTVHLLPMISVPERFAFSRPDGTLIGIVYQQVVDTSCWVCMVWSGEVCLNWQRFYDLPWEQCDSLEIVYDSIPIIDTSQIVVYGGTVIIAELPIPMGDFDCDGSTNITDLVALINYMFNGGPPSACPESLDCDGNGEGPNIADLVCIVNWMFPPQ